MQSKLAKCHNINDLLARAKGRLSAPIFHYMDGGADDELAMRENSSRFDQYLLVPETLRDVSTIDLKTGVLEQALALPVFLSSTGMNQLFHHHTECALTLLREEIKRGMTLLGCTNIADIISHKNS